MLENIKKDVANGWLPKEERLPFILYLIGRGAKVFFWIAIIVIIVGVAIAAGVKIIPF